LEVKATQQAPYGAAPEEGSTGEAPSGAAVEVVQLADRSVRLPGASR